MKMIIYTKYNFPEKETTTFRKWLLQFVKKMAPSYPMLSILNENGKMSNFMRWEIQFADKILCISEEDCVKAFAVLNTKRDRVINLILMGSLEKGLGTQIIDFLKTDSSFQHKFIIGRSIKNAIGFYLRMGFELFNYIQSDGYVTGKTDPELTNMIRSDPDKVVSILRNRKWIPKIDEDIFPILFKRDVNTIKEESVDMECDEPELVLLDNHAKANGFETPPIGTNDSQIPLTPLNGVGVISDEIKFSITKDVSGSSFT